MRASLVTVLALLTLAPMAVAPSALADDLRLSVVDTGVRDYYCTTTVRLENAGAETVNDLNGFLVLLAGEAEVGQSRASSFFALDPGAVADVTFDAPNAPCADVTGLRFVVGACRIDQSFRDQADCAARIAPVAPIAEAIAR